MRSHLTNRSAVAVTIQFSKRLVIGAVLLLSLAACSSQAAREAELAAQAAAVAAQEQEAARAAQEQERQLAAEQQRQREAEAAERAQLQAQRERQAEEARQRAAAERQEREAAEARERARLAALAAAEAERQAKLDRISSLQAQIAALQTQARNDESATAYLSEAVAIAEELLEALAAEQAKYETTDAAGNTVEPLEKDLIAELEARKDDLVRRASAAR